MYTVVIDMTELIAAEDVVFYDILKATMPACESLTNLDVNEVESLWFQPPMPQKCPITPQRAMTDVHVMQSAASTHRLLLLYCR